MGPIGWIGYIPMFHRVPVDVIHVRPEVGIIADKMFPEAVLLDSSLANSTCESVFDQSPAGREIVFAFGKRPDGVNVVG